MTNVRRNGIILGFALMVLALAIVYSNIRYHIIYVEGHSMEPALYAGQWYIVDELAEPRAGDIIELQFTGDTNMSVKRVAYDSSAPFVYVYEDIIETYDDDGRATVEKWYDFRPFTDQAEVEKSSGAWLYRRLVLAKGEYIVLGDNMSVSEDSRTHGVIYRSQVRGVVRLL